MHRVVEQFRKIVASGSNYLLIGFRPETVTALANLIEAVDEWEDAEGANHAADFTNNEHEAWLRRERAVADLRMAAATLRIVPEVPV